MLTNPIIRTLTISEVAYVELNTTVVSHSIVTGKITPADLNQAIYFLEKKFQALRLCIIPQNSGYVYTETVNRLNCKAEWLNDVTPEAVYTKLLNAKLDLTNGLYKIYVVHHSNHFHIFMLSSHAITDGQALITLHTYLINYLEHALQNITPNIVEQPLLLDIDSIVNEFLQTKIGAPATTSTPVATIPDQLLLLPTQARTATNLDQRMSQFHITAAGMQKITTACKLHNVSVHSLLTAALAIAVKQLDQTRPGEYTIIRHAVNLRNQINPEIASDAILTAAAALITVVDVTKDIWDCAIYVHKYIHDPATTETLLRDYPGWRQRFKLAQKLHPPAINVSNMGLIPSVITQNLYMQQFDFVAGWANPFPNISVSSTNGNLVANLAYATQFISTRHATEFMQLVYANLTKV